MLDLDGTLIDTAPDMAAALNQLLTEHEQPQLAFDEIRPHVSQGAMGLIGIAFREVPMDDERFERLRKRFLEIYAAVNGKESCLFEGFQGVLEHMDSTGMPWGIVTNKPAWLSEPLVTGLGIGDRAGCLVCGDTLDKRKPDPAPLLHAAGLLKTEPAQCVYVGDAQRDMEAAMRAGMQGIVATYGYIVGNSRPAEWPADAVIEKPTDLLSLFGLI